MQWAYSDSFFSVIDLAKNDLGSDTQKNVPSNFRIAIPPNSSFHSNNLKQLINFEYWAFIRSAEKKFLEFC